MIAIDCGNTRLKWARFEGLERRDGGHASFRGEADPFAALGHALIDESERVLVANVAGDEVAARVADAVRLALGREPEFVAVEPSAHGVECAYSDPGTLGVDRWVAMIAARRLVDGPFAVVGAGTALTFDAVDGSGQHLGGLILPGDRLMLETLSSRAEQLPAVEPAASAPAGLGLLGRSTAEAMSYGARLALAAAVDRAAAAVATALDAKLTMFLTGGDAPVLADWLASEASVKADLVLEGLALIGRDEE